MISNLLINSIYALSAGATFYIDVRDSETEPQGVAFTIQDNGVGISPEDLPRVFDAFFTTRATIGIGIGLFIAKQLVEGHGGRITIESARARKNMERKSMSSCRASVPMRNCRRLTRESNKEK